MKKKNLDEIWFQYLRALSTAFPKLRFKQSTCNWSKVYPNEDPYKNTRFLLIYHAYQNTLRKHGIKKD